MSLVRQTAALGLAVFFLFLVLGIPEMDKLFLIHLESVNSDVKNLLQWSAYIGFLTSMMYMAVEA